MIRVLIADDHTIVRDALKKLCGGMEGFVVAAIAENGDGVLEALSHGEFDMILLDLSMPGVSGSDLVERVHALYPDLHILVFSMRNEAYVVKHVLQAGASGYVSKGSRQEVLMDAIRKVADGERFVDPVIAEQMIFDKRIQSPSVSHGTLSEREAQILKLLAQGKGGNEIADELFLSSKTVSTYKMRLMKKLNFTNNADLVLYAAEAGLIEK